MFRSFAPLLLGGLVTVFASGCSGGGSSALTHVPASASTNSGALHQVQDTQRNATAGKASSIIAINDNFSTDTVGSAAAGWNVVNGTWSVCQAGTTHAYCETLQSGGESLDGASWWTDYSIDALISDPNVSVGGVGVIGRVTSPNQYYQFELRPLLNTSTPYWYLEKNNNGAWTTLASGPLHAPDNNPNYRLHLAFSGDQIAASIAFDGGTNYIALSTVSDSSFAAGQVGLRTWGTATGLFNNVLVTRVGAPLPSESAISAGTFVDSIGMDAHFESSIYYQNMAQVRSLIANLGIHHYRVSAANILGGGTYLSNITNLFTSYGTTFDVLTDLYTSPARVVTALGLLPPGSVDSVEGPNETDNPGQGMYYDPKFATDVPAYMQSLYATIKSTPATSQLTVIGPSFVNSTSYAAVGNISSYVDTGNMHNYFSGFNPGTLGWGGGGYSFAPGLNYGSIAWNIASVGQATGAKPVITTETGYSTAPIHSAVPYDVQAKYVPRLYFEQYRHSVPRTFMYQLIGYDMTTADGTLDIVSPSFVPSPAYNALSAMIALLNDGGLKSAPEKFHWGLSGQTANVDHVLLHKADGTLVLPLWIEVPSFDPNANGGLGAEIAVAPQAVTVDLPREAKTGVLWTCNPATGTWSSKALTITNGAIVFNVSDSVSILEVASY